MPFTATHVAAAVPIAWLCRWQVPISALAIGTMVPDLGVFFPWFFDYYAFHTAQGILTHCTPFGLALYYVFQLLLKRPMADLLPTALRQRVLPRIDRPLDFRLRQILLVSCLVALGAWTHVLWDSFTHQGRWGTRLLPFLNREALEFYGWPIKWCSIFQHGSTLIFLPPLLGGCWWWIRNQEASEVSDGRARMPLWVSWPAIAGWVLALAIRTVWIQLQHPEYLVSIHSFRFAVKELGAVALLLLILYGAAMQIAWAISPKDDSVAADSVSSASTASEEIAD